MNRDEFLEFSAERGWVVFPYQGATPPKGFLNTVETDREACSTSPHSLGVLTGNGLLVVDIDSPDARVLADFVAHYKAKPTFTVGTPSGGWHLYFRIAKTLKLAKRIKGKGMPDVLAHVDLFCGGQHVIAPPWHRKASNRKPEGTYAVVGNDPVAWAPKQLIADWQAACEAPALDLGEMVESIPDNERDWALRKHAELVKEAADAAEGERENTLYSNLCASIRFAVYMPDVLSVEQVTADYESSCPVAAEIKDMDSKVRRAVELAQSRPWHAFAEKTDDEPNGEADSSAFWQSREALRRIAETAKLNGDSPWAVLGVVLARVAADVPVGVRLHTQQSVKPTDVPNLYAVLPALSGGGKTSAASAAKLLWPGRLAWAPSTPEFIWDELADEERGHSLLVEYDELVGLGQVGNRPGNPLIHAFCSAWAGTFANYGSREGRRAGREPLADGSFRLCMYGGIQPRLAKMFFDKTGDASGLTQRMLWFDPTAVGDERPRFDRDAPPVEVPSLKPESFGAGPSRALVVSYPYAAMDQMAEHAWGVKKGWVPVLDTHLAWNRAKVAYLLAVLDQRVDKVTMEDWALAGVIIQHSVSTRELAQRAMEDGRRRGAVNSKVSAAEVDAEAEEAVYARSVEHRARWLLKKRVEFPDLGDGEIRGKLSSKHRGESWNGHWADVVELANNLASEQVGT